jgi:hypothetical protein
MLTLLTLAHKYSSLCDIYMSTMSAEREASISPLNTIQSQFLPLPIQAAHLPKIHFNIILLSLPRFIKWMFTKRFSHQNYVCISYV